MRIGYDLAALPMLGIRWGVFDFLRGYITWGWGIDGDGPNRVSYVRGRGFVKPPLRMIIWDLSGALAALEDPMPLRPVSHLLIRIRSPIYTNYHPHPYYVMHQLLVYIWLLVSPFTTQFCWQQPIRPHPDLAHECLLLIYVTRSVKFSMILVYFSRFRKSKTIHPTWQTVLDHLLVAGC